MTVFEVDKPLFSFLVAASGVLGVLGSSALLFCSAKDLRYIEQSDVKGTVKTFTLQMLYLIQSAIRTL